MTKKTLKYTLTVQACKLVAFVSLLTLSFSAGTAFFQPIMAVQTDTYGWVYTGSSYVAAWGLAGLTSSFLIYSLPIVELSLKNKEKRS